MDIRTFELKDILPNPFRRVEKYPLVEAKVDNLVESIKTTGFWENIIVRINGDSQPEIAFGHHRLSALRKVYPETQAFDWNVRALTDGQMIQMMARENGESYRSDPSVLRETITATLKALGEGKIGPEEMPIGSNASKQYIRYAPGFETAPSTGALRQYTKESLAKFLGLARPTGNPQDSFDTAFATLELMSEGYLTEAQVKGADAGKLSYLVRVARAYRDGAMEQREAKEAKGQEIDKKAMNAAKAKVREFVNDFARETKSMKHDDVRKAVKEAVEHAEYTTFFPENKPEDEDDEPDEDDEVCDPDLERRADAMEEAFAQERARRRQAELNAAEEKKAMMRLLEDAKALVKYNRKAFATEVHPDRTGGPDEPMQRVNAAKEWLLKLVEAAASGVRCPCCQGFKA